MFTYQSPTNLASPLQPPDDTPYRVSTLITQPISWDQNKQLKSLVSHMDPQSACDVLHFHSNNTQLGVKFFKWVCKQSTYCYGLDGRIYLLHLMFRSKLFAILHKAIIVVINECNFLENEVLKLMGALDHMRKSGFRLNCPCYSTLLTCLAKLQMGISAFFVYKSIVSDGVNVGFIDYKTILNALCKNGFVQAAEMFFSKVLKLGFLLDVHVYTSLVLGNCRVGGLLEAYRVFEIMSEEEGCGANSVTYSILIHGLCEAGRLGEACRLKEEMSEKGCQPSTRTYTVLIKAICDIGLTDKALVLLDEMVKKGCNPNVHTYTILIDRLCSEGKIEEANGMFREMLKAGLTPNTITFNALINGYCKDGRVVSAFELLSMMEKRNCKPNIRTYNELMEGLCRVNEPYKAMTLLRRIVDNGLFPDRVTYNILVDGLCQKGQLDMAFRILSSMNSVGLEPDGLTYTTLIDTLCKGGKVEQANGLLGLMVKRGLSPDEVTYTALIDGHCKTGKIGYAFVLFERMVDIRCFTTPHSFNSFLDVLCKDLKINEGNAVFGKMLKYGLLPSVVTFTILIDGMCRVGDIARALTILERMKQSGCLPNVYTYSVVINGLCQNGRVEEAETLLHDMPRLGVSPNDISYTPLVKAHVKAGKLGRAFDTVSIMMKNLCRPNHQIYSALLAGFVLSDIGKEAGALSSISDLNTGETSVDCSSNYLFTAMDITHAVTLLDKIKECGGETVDLYNFLIMGLCRVGRTCEADRLMQDMVKLGLFPDKDVCSFVVEHFCRDQKYDHCLEWMKPILDKGLVPSFASYCSVVRAIGNEGEVTQAQRLVSDLIRHAGIEDSIAVSRHVEFLVKEDEPYKRLELLKLIEQMYLCKRPIV
ncbi:hypothetical protein RJ640_025379 [Escallonia rubra]|uniref:Pentatricopeptide repeat-containing protein n=1 Tax=Escallonia rubra TaxID=112253 RepID=A0AA88U511_9ASTE|nr:hypothetical protein RJ640_025379 [Escallonia rubra]